MARRTSAPSSSSSKTAGHAHLRSTSDADHLAQITGHESELKRHFSPLAMLGMAFAILNSWTALAASLSLALPSGGPTSVLWGLLTAGIGNLCLAASLAEFLGVWPTAGGQYHWTAVIAWKPWVPILSYMTGWINCAGWVALTATGGLLGSQLIMGVISLYSPSFVPQRWHQFLIYIGYTVFAFIVNTFANKGLPFVNQAALVWSLLGFTVICITVLACSRPNYASAEFVFGEFVNTTGWPDGVAWLLGLLQGGLGLTGYDAVAHMIEELPNATKEGPKVMIYCVCIGLVTGFLFLMILLFVSGGNAQLNNIIASPTGPLLQILYIATGSKAGATVLLLFPLICLLFATTGIMTTSSRMTWAFARDRGLPFSRTFAKVHPSLGVPLNSLILTTALVILFGCIFLGSSSAFNAITAASVVALGLSYGIPIAINCARGRSQLPESRPFKLPGVVGWVLNLVGIGYVVLTTVLFVFPPVLPTTGANMNYCIAAFAAVILVASVQWAVDSRKTFKGPKVVVLEGEVGGREVVTGEDVGMVGMGEGKGEKSGV